MTKGRQENNEANTDGRIAEGQITAKFEFTNVKCVPYDLKFNDFEHCYLKSVNQTYKYVSIKCRLFQTPVTKFNLLLYKRFNGYRPFMYNVSVDVCKFQLNRNVNPIMKFFYDIVEPYSNINHTCPFNVSLTFEDLVLEKLPVDFINHRITDVLPFPDYVVETNWIAYDIKRAVVKFYGTLS
ncbi:LOW QUALITY PROTEIN: uncharacterized protein LOC110190751 [Drosophila serrata]|uniref:LOW QUALITY PROTEIN: uncharacterized protein LOC110190751 n=1 Tax=Drosophila serrata TaxID=7274 RepID=UPI000A1D3308|nr:LOW QUALITY PROTEIN: uncharacterized protein LOC110190751 [Drosophila serrata]